MVWKITFTTLGDLPGMLLFLLRGCVTALWDFRQCVGFKQIEISLDPDQLASYKPGDLDILV